MGLIFTAVSPSFPESWRWRKGHVLLHHGTDKAVCPGVTGWEDRRVG